MTDAVYRDINNPVIVEQCQREIRRKNLKSKKRKLLPVHVVDVLGVHNRK